MSQWFLDDHTAAIAAAAAVGYGYALGQSFVQL
jgi:hypothetical protein